MNAKRWAPVFLSFLVFSPPVLGRQPQKSARITAVRMDSDVEHKMIRVGCQINRGRRYLCVIDSGSTYTIISDRVLRPEGPLMDVITAKGVLRMHEQEVSLTIAEGLELRSHAIVLSNSSMQKIYVFI